MCFVRKEFWEKGEGKLRRWKEKVAPEVSEGEEKAMEESPLLKGLKDWKGKVVKVKVRRQKEKGGYYTESHTGKIIAVGTSLVMEEGGKKGEWISENGAPCLFLEEKHVIQAIYLYTIEDVDDEVPDNDPIRVHFTALNRP